MKAGWEVKPLQDLCNNFRQDIVDGPFGSELQRKDYVNQGIPVLKIQNIKPYDVELKKMDYVSSKKYQELKRHSFRDGDIVMTKLGNPLGVSAIVNEITEGLIVADLVRIRAQKVDTKYLCYQLNSQFVSDFINARQKGTTRPRVTLSVVRELPIATPSLSEQQRIVAILDQAFEGIAKARANAEQNLQNAPDLFESYLHSIDTENRELGEFVSIKTGKLDANAAVKDGLYPFFTCSRDVYRIDNFAFDCEAILLAGNNASGDFNVKHYMGKFNAYQRTYVITVKNENEASYRYLYFQLLAKLKEFKKQSVGSNTRFLKIGMIQGMKIPMPSLVEQEAIVVKLDGLLRETQHLEALYQRKIACLDELKKSLLQQAFAGKL